MDRGVFQIESYVPTEADNIRRFAACKATCYGH